jgi:beta-lactamase superfamily II metal-dependent hydrolase
MTRVSEFATTLPAAYYYVVEPSWPMIALYYLLLVAGLTGWLRLKKRTFAQIMVLTSVVAAISIWVWNLEFIGPNARLTLLPLSGGQVVFVDGPGGHNQMLINCGNAAAVDATLKPFLRAHGINDLPQLILTAGEQGGSGGADRLRQLFRVDKLYTSTNHFRSLAYRDFLAQFDHQRGGHNTLRFNDTVAGWHVLHPGPTDNWPRADDNALVLRGQLRGATILLLADLGRNGQSALLARTNDLRADIIITSLPGKGEALCDDLIHAVHPRLIVVVESDFPITSRAGIPMKRRLAKTGIPVIYTRLSGAVTIVAHQDDWNLSTMDGQTFTFLNAER